MKAFTVWFVFHYAVVAHKTQRKIRLPFGQLNFSLSLKKKNRPKNSHNQIRIKSDNCQSQFRSCRHQNNKSRSYVKLICVKIFHLLFTQHKIHSIFCDLPALSGAYLIISIGRRTVLCFSLSYLLFRFFGWFDSTISRYSIIIALYGLLTLHIAPNWTIAVTSVCFDVCFAVKIKNTQTRARASIVWLKKSSFFLYFIILWEAENQNVIQTKISKIGDIKTG